MRFAVYTGSSPGDRESYAKAAADLATRLVRQGHGIVYGGGRVGLMGVVADAALTAGGDVVGVMPQSLVDREIAHRGLTRLDIVSSMLAGLLVVSSPDELAERVAQWSPGRPKWS